MEFKRTVFESGKKYQCVANCPELDFDHEKHCMCDGETLDEACAYGTDCPCGNNTKWEEVES